MTFVCVLTVLMTFLMIRGGLSTAVVAVLFYCDAYYSFNPNPGVITGCSLFEILPFSPYHIGVSLSGVWKWVGNLLVGGDSWEGVRSGFIWIGLYTSMRPANRYFVLRYYKRKANLNTRPGYNVVGFHVLFIWV